MSARKKNINNVGKTILVVLGLGACTCLYFLYRVFGPNTGTFSTGEYLYIRTGANYNAVKETLVNDGFIRNINSFDLVAERAGYPDRIHAGKYHLKPGMSNYAMVRILRGGHQEQVRVVINKLRTKQDFITLLGTDLEADSAVLKRMFTDPVYLAQFGLDTNTVMCAVMPSTYYFFWNTTADNAFKKIEKNYAQFWTPARVAAAAAHHLQPAQAVIAASIVDEETNKNGEKPNIASVYLNRLVKGMKLQADPTVKFAVGDFGLRRITGLHLQAVSPYNTYMYAGLPPGPICTPSVSSIEAVLHAANTNYLYFCAKEDFSGYHNFAATYPEQIKNARLYQQALNAKGIH
jgi:UPF0755 protein